ncbi:hypothetical protein DSO57_1001960 [Entomophthora muscae]|uniref:Uncharacterized protein n=1 Tax=Entomophthora muscae TaxID=34485 RepID=A0ACC2UTR1_9FUNG|nr:hypothetical protein DSO57_1001960 [Entomophthora muscae]
MASTLPTDTPVAEKKEGGFWSKIRGSGSKKPEPETPIPPPATNINPAPDLTSGRKTKQQAESRIRLIRQYALLLDAIPGLPIKIGLDGLIGLIPGVGDLSTGLVSVFLIYLARDLNMPNSLILKMYSNILIDTAVGTIPVFGDVFDVLYKSNLKNTVLIEKWFEKNSHKFEDAQGEASRLTA